MTELHGFVQFVMKVINIFFIKIMNKEKLISIIDSLELKNIDSIQFYESSINIDYDDILNVWRSFLKNRFMDEDDKLEINNLTSIYKIAKSEETLGMLLEECFKRQLNEVYDDLLLIYIKESDDLLILYKSYKLLENDSKIKLPFWDYLINCKSVNEKITKLYKKKENICIMSYILK